MWQNHPIKGSFDSMSESSNFGDHWRCDIIFISYVTSHDSVLKRLCDFMGGRPSQQVATLPCLVVIGLEQVEIQSI